MTTTHWCLATLTLSIALAGCLDGGPWEEDDEVSSSSIGTRSSALKVPTCRIGGVRYAAGEQNPADPCETCEPSVTARAWTVLDPACYEPPPPAACESVRDCGSGLACIDGVCSADCTSDSQCAPPLHCVLGGGGCQL